jgi:hypothetical protein
MTAIELGFGQYVKHIEDTWIARSISVCKRCAKTAR